MSSPFSKPGSIRHIEVLRPGGPDEMHLTEGAVPALGPDDVRIHVEAAGINHADLLQRAGKYAVPSTA